MSNEGKRKPRGKLDSIISKLRKSTPEEADVDESSGKRLERKQKENQDVEAAGDLLQKKSKRKAGKTVRYKRAFFDDEDEKEEVEVNSLDKPVENGFVETSVGDAVGQHGTLDDGEPGFSNPSELVQSSTEEPVVYENTLASFEQIAGVSLSQESSFDDQKGNTDKKKKHQPTESSCEKMELPSKIECTSCGRQINPAHGKFCRHSLLHVVVCKKCNQYYNSGPFTRDEFGIEEQCRWCGDGGALVCCDKCEKAFCKKCIKRNLGKAVLKELQNAPDDIEWLCYVCNPKPLSKLIKTCNKVMLVIEAQKSHKKLFKGKSGDIVKQGPNQLERRSKLSSLSVDMGIKIEGLSAGESSMKKHFEDIVCDGETSEEEDERMEKPSKKTNKKTKKTDSDVTSEDDENEDPGKQTKRRKVVKHEEQNESDFESAKTRRKAKGNKRQIKQKEGKRNQDEVLLISDDESSEPKTKKKQSKDNTNSKEHKTRRKPVSSEDENSEPKTKKKQRSGKNKTNSKGHKTRRKPVSSEDESSEPNSKKKQRSGKDKTNLKRKRSRRKPVSSADESSDDFDNFVSMVKGTNMKKRGKQRDKVRKHSLGKRDLSSDGSDEEDLKKRQKGRKTRKETKRQGKGQKRSRVGRDSSSDSSDEEDLKKTKKKTLQKKTRKRRRKVQSSDSALEKSSKSESSDEESPKNKKRKRKRVKLDESDSDSASDKKKRKKKGKGKGKQRRRIRRSSSDSVSEDEEDPSPSKRTKGRRDIRKLIADNELAEETKKARRLEEERRKRLLERTQLLNEEVPKDTNKQVSRLVLENDPDTKEPLVEVKEQIVEYLKPHQCKGIQFMYNCIIDSVQSWKKEEPGGGCILAHCMGLGKTFQVVALAHTLVNNPSIRMQRILVVCPLNTVLNWQVEFEKWLSVDDRLEVYVLQEVGPNNWRRSDMLKDWNRYGGVMILGYDMYRNLSQCSRVRSKHQKKIFKESLVDPGPELVICDEGHILRNDTTAIAKALNGMKTRRRIVLTGTPLQNNLIEYHCMVSFVKPNLLGTRKEFTNSFANPIQNGQCADSTPADVSMMKKRSHVLFKMLEGCVQRMDYAALLPFLPPKHEYVIKVRLSTKQRKLYQHFLDTFVLSEGELCKRGATLFSDYQALMRIWTHPWCLRLEALRRPERFDDTDSMEDFIVHSDEDTEEEEEEESLKSTTSEEENNSSSPESSESEKERSHKAQDESSEEEEVVVRRRRTQRRQLRSVASPTVEIDGEEVQVVELDVKPGMSGVKGKPISSTSNGKGKSKSSEKEKSHSAERNGNKNQESRTRVEESEQGTFGSTRSGAAFKDDVSDVETEKEWYDEFLSEDDQSNVELSGKLVLLMEILADAEAVGDKVLVFSQSLVTLDLIEKALGGGQVGGDNENWCRGCDYFRMDGSTSANMRQRWADIFNSQDNETARLFLISTRAGGLGINMVAANRVIMFDVSWNPSHDVQSIFRVFRFGQTKNVFVYRFVAQGTMEEKIYERQVTKLSLSERVVDQHQIERHFTAADLAGLYEFNPDTLTEEEAEKEGEPGDEPGSEAATASNQEHDNRISNGEYKEQEEQEESENGQVNGERSRTSRDKDMENSTDAKEQQKNTTIARGKPEQTTAKKTAIQRPTLPLPKDAVLADLINRVYPKWIVTYLEHDSLLQNIESEELTEEECREAWAAYEAEKEAASNPAAAIRQQMQQYAVLQQQQQQQQMQQQMQQQRHEVAAHSQQASRLQLNASLIRQIQQMHQQQETERQQRFREEMQRLRREREENLYRQQEVYRQQQQQSLSHLILNQQATQPAAANFQPRGIHIGGPLRTQPGLQPMFGYPRPMDQAQGSTSRYLGEPQASGSIRRPAPSPFLARPRNVPVQVDLETTRKQ